MINILQTWFARIFGTLLGLSGAGFFGAMAGFAIGSLIDKLHRDGFFLWEKESKNSESGDFIFSTMILATAILKAKSDHQSENKFIHIFLNKQYGEKKAIEYLKILKKTMKQDWDILKIAQQLRRKNNYETRLQLLFFLFGIANADITIENKELALLKIIGLHLGIQADDFEAISSNYLSELDKSYKILHITKSAGEMEIKDAFRKMANKYHPDKMSESIGLSSFAQEKFQKVQLAYDRIRTEKGFK
jgi:DnaJ like chaperone protein